MAGGSDGSYLDSVELNVAGENGWTYGSPLSKQLWAPRGVTVMSWFYIIGELHNKLKSLKVAKWRKKNEGWRMRDKRWRMKDGMVAWSLFCCLRGFEHWTQSDANSSHGRKIEGNVRPCELFASDWVQCVCWLTNRQTYICDWRIAFATENIGHIIFVTRWPWWRCHPSVPRRWMENCWTHECTKMFSCCLSWKLFLPQQNHPLSLAIKKF